VDWQARHDPTEAQQFACAVVDDDEGVRQALNATFASAGLWVSCFKDAEGFLAETEEQRWVCLVSDVQMPGTGGLELARQVRAAIPSLPVILITAYTGDALRTRAADLGVVYVYDKPFDADDLLRRVQSLISQQ
jgi:FixJ family two-component response regulator